jgi:hypothetical protein
MLLLDTAPGSPLTHRDGRRFSSGEIRTALTATPDDRAVAAEILTAATDVAVTGDSERGQL